MKIRNIDADQEDVKRIARFSDFVLDTINTAFKYEVSKLNKKDLISSEPISATNISNYPIHKFANIDYCNIANLIHTIPIYLKKKRPFKGIKEERICKDLFDEIWKKRPYKGIKEESIEKETNEDKIDLLGAYFSNRPNGIPYIEIYANNINAAVTKECVTNDTEYKWLFTKVLIHELAHAALDIYNWEKFSGINKIPYTLGFGVWREESTANALTLMIIKRTDNKEFYTYAKDFMKTQPKAYRLGILMEDFGYETFISVMRNKIEGVRPKLKKAWLTDVKKLSREWLKDIKKIPDTNELKEWNKKLTR